MRVNASRVPFSQTHVQKRAGRLRILLYLSFALTLCVPTLVAALPEFAAEVEQECSFCHFDPAGGGPRNEVGEIFEENGFVFPEDFDIDAVMEEVQEIVKRLNTSLELQTLYLKTAHVDDSEGTTAGCTSCHSSVDRFLLMQAKVTFNAQASERLRLTVAHSVLDTPDAFATIDAIPEALYFKVGKFKVPFGINQKDHNILIRDGYGQGSNKREIGVELGGSTGNVFYNAALFNASNTAAKAGFGNLGAQIGPIRAGVSTVFEKSGEAWTRLIGTFLTASYSGFSVAGEFNFGNTEEAASFSPDAVDSKGYYLEAKYRIHPKFSLGGRYGLFDPDRSVKGDARRRITLTADYNFMENGRLSLLYWGNLANPDLNLDDPPADKGTRRQLQGTDQIILMSNFWF